MALYHFPHGLSRVFFNFFIYLRFFEKKLGKKLPGTSFFEKKLGKKLPGVPLASASGDTNIYAIGV